MHAFFLLLSTKIWFLNVFLASQSEVTRRLEKSTSYDNDETGVEGRCLLSRSEISHGEHPLSLGKASIWNQFFQVTILLVDLKLAYRGVIEFLASYLYM